MVSISDIAVFCNKHHPIGFKPRCLETRTYFSAKACTEVRCEHSPAAPTLGLPGMCGLFLQLCLPPLANTALLCLGPQMLIKSLGLLARAVQHSARALSALKTLISSGQTRSALHFSSGILTSLLPAQSAGRSQLCFWGLLLLFCLYHNLDQETDGRLPATLLTGPCPSCCLLPMDRFLIQGIPTDFSWSPGLCHL